MKKKELLLLLLPCVANLQLDIFHMTKSKWWLWTGKLLRDISQIKIKYLIQIHIISIRCRVADAVITIFICEYAIAISRSSCIYKFNLKLIMLWKFGHVHDTRLQYRWFFIYVCILIIKLTHPHSWRLYWAEHLCHINL